MSRTARKPADRPVFAPGARVVVRDEEWIVRETQPCATGGSAVRCTGLSELVRDKDAIFLTELDAVRELRPEQTDLVMDASPHFRKSRLYLESLLRQTPPTDERIYLGHQGAMNAAEYQLLPAAQALAQPRPRILIADGVGLGKTIEVGVLLTELIRRGRGRRILVVALKSILAQFQKELWSRFTIPLVRLDSVGIQRVQAKIPSNSNPFRYFDRVIISVDTLKKGGQYPRWLEDAHWDAIVIDECQHVAERARLSSSQLSQRAKVAKLLARTCDALVLTSATPHDGRPESFASLMNLLEPTAVANPSSYGRDEIDGLFVRRFKKDVVHEVRGSFQERQVYPVRVEASAAENAVFDRLAEASFRTLTPRRTTSGTPGGQGGGVLLQTLLLKAFLSSPAALASTLVESLGSARLGDDRVDDPAVRHDRATLHGLQTAVAAVPEAGFTKLATLVALLREIGVGDRARDTRVVVFSERIQTLKLLQVQLGEALSLGEKEVAIFHGGLDDQDQLALVEQFQTAEGKVRVLLASDAASEGINLHFFCNQLVHFDIPWSLITLEQRNGRIDRYGQTKQPQIHYLLTVPANEQTKGDLRVLERLIEKENEAQKNIGDAASLFKLYDATAEEERIAEGIAAHAPAEEIVPEVGEGDFLAELLGDAPGQRLLVEESKVAQTVTLFDGDVPYMREAFAQVIEDAPGQTMDLEWHDHLMGLTLQAPDDLQRRYRYMPPELRRGNSWEFKLTADRALVQRALEASRKSGSTWPEWELLWAQHPIAQWLSDRVVSSFRRHEAPVLRVPTGLGASEAGLLFQGVMSNRRSQPMIVEWFAVVKTAASPRIVPFTDLVGVWALPPSMANAAVEFDVSELLAWRETAVEAARAHMLGHRAARGDRLRETLKQHQRKIKTWETKSLERLDAQQQRWAGPSGTLRSDQARKLAAARDEVAARVEARKRWIEDGLATVDRPYLRLAAGLVGAAYGRKGRGS